MEFVLFLFLVALAVAGLAGWTVDTRDPDNWHRIDRYPAR